MRTVAAATVLLPPDRDCLPSLENLLVRASRDRTGKVTYSTVRQVRAQGKRKKSGKSGRERRKGEEWDWSCSDFRSGHRKGAPPISAPRCCAVACGWGPKYRVDGSTLKP